MTVWKTWLKMPMGVNPDHRMMIKEISLLLARTNNIYYPRGQRFYLLS
jgi:hypothetical protein